MGHPFTSAHALEHPTDRTPLSPETVLKVRATAAVWAERGYEQTAANLLAVLDRATQPREPRPLPAGVADFAAYQRRRAVTQ